MSTTATIMQLVRAHMSRNDAAFHSAAKMLARSAKTPAIRDGIIMALHQGYPRTGSGPSQANTTRQPMKLTQSGGLLQPLPEVTFSDLLLPTEQQQLLDEMVIELEYRKELASRNLRARNRLLFYGPPGNGKTSSAAAMAQALGVSAYGVSLPSLVSRYMGATGENLGQLFGALTPDTVVVFDELDAIGARRTDGESGAAKEQNSVVNTILTLLDRCTDGVIIGTTNRPDMLDPALLRRFDEQIFFPPPSLAQLNQLMQRLCEYYRVPEIHVGDCENFDAATKKVRTEARRAVMRELLKSDEANEEETDNGTDEEEANEEARDRANSKGNNSSGKGSKPGRPR